MSADIGETQPHSLSANPTCSSGFMSYSHRGDTRSLSMDELEEEYQQLKEENHQLQLRILGVNELARLLQDKNEQLTLVEEKNKRLEVAVVRLENRCSNIEKLSKKGGLTSLPAKTSQSPFIPGPSRQVLEGLMKENSELKKTLNNLTKKGASGYLEAVKITQLEEVIECQKEELQFTRDQIRQLTDGASEDTGPGGGLSLPANVSESGPLKRQLIKLQHSIKVKDRFCALLSQQISELQGKLSVAQQQTGQSDSSKLVESTLSMEQEKSTSQSEQTDAPPSDMESKYQKLLDEKTRELDQLRASHTATLEKLDRLERDLKSKTKEAEDADKLRDQLALYVSEKEELVQTLETAQKDLEILMSKDSGGGGGEGGMSMEAFKRMERERDDLRKVIEDQTKQATEMRTTYDTDLLVLKAQLENEEYKRAIASSDMEHKINLLGQEKAELNRDIEIKDDKIVELQDEVESLQSRVTELQEVNLQYKMNLGKSQLSAPTISRGSGYASSLSTGMSGLEKPFIYGNNSNYGLLTAKDGPQGENRFSPISCEKPMALPQDFRREVLAREPVKSVNQRPTQLPPNHGYQSHPNMGRSSPSLTLGQGPYYQQQYGSMQQQPPRSTHPGGMLNPPPSGFRSPVMYRPGPPGGTQQLQQSSSSYRSHTYPVSTPVAVVTSPTYIAPRPGSSYSQSSDHPLTTTSSMYSQGGAMFSQPGGHRGVPPGGMRPAHTYQHSEDELSGGQRSPSIPGGQRSPSIPGGQRSPSPNPQGGHRNP